MDGFGAALEALAELAQEGDEAEDIHAALNEHWEESLVEWLAEDCGRRVEPPEFG